MTQYRISRAITAGAAVLAGPLALAPPAPATAGALPSARVAIDSAIFVEHIDRGNGAPVRSLEPATRLEPGERVVTLVNWSRAIGVATGGFVVVNALPARLNYQQSSQADEDVSVDGGHSWGRLGSLRVSGRIATAADVTHVRWHVSPAQAAEGRGQIAYAGIVR